MTQVDTSFYKMPVQKSPLEVAGQIANTRSAVQGNISNDIAIDKQKLDLVNQQFGIMNNELAGLANGNYTKEQAAGRLNTIAKTLNLPPNVVQHMTAELNASPDVKSFAQTAIVRGMQTMDKVAQLYGQNTSVQDQKNIHIGVQQSPMQGGALRPVNRIPIQIAPGTQGYDEGNKLQLEQPEGPSGVVPAAPPVAAPVQPQVQSANRMPVAQPPAPAPSLPPPDTAPATFAERTDAAFQRRPLSGGPDVLFPEGKEAYAKDQMLASAKAQGIKPAVQALKLMPGLSTGPGTDQFNQLAAAAKAWGIVDTKAENDPTALRQELNKKLAQYVGSSPIGQRSDAAQVLAEAGAPNPKVQITQALQNLTRDAIALDRVQMLMPQAFKGSDYQNYIKHKGTFPQSIDEKALSLDMLPDEDRAKLVNRMVKQYRDGDASQKRVANKFLETLKMAREAGVYEGM